MGIKLFYQFSLIGFEMFEKSIAEIIKTRESWRSYLPQQFTTDMKNQIQNLLQTQIQSPFNGTTRFVLIEIPEIDPLEKKQLGTYGFIQGAQYFIVGATKKSSFDLEHYGYALETIILKATELGLGTCWLGGTFKKSAFAQQLQICEDEKLPAITPIGFAPKQHKLKDRVIRWAIKSSNRFPWDVLFFEYNHNDKTVMSLSKSSEKMLDSYLELVRLAPSAKNKQPWRVLKDPLHSSYHFYLQKTKGHPQKGVFNFQRLDIGIAVCHFDLMRIEQKVKGKWIFGDPKYNVSNEWHYTITFEAEK